MTGYTRQSSGSIQNTLDITAAPLNAEFDKVRDAFNISSGHTHTGTGSDGDGPKIPLGTSVSGYLPAANGGVGGINNVTATTDPTVNNDVDENYAVGSLWINTTTGRAWICVGNTDGAAVWRSQAHVSATDSAIVPDTDATSSTGISLGTLNKRFADLFLAQDLSVVGNASVGGSVTCTSLTQTSDYRAKTVDGDLYQAGDDIMAAQPVMATMHNEDVSRPMFIAHELQKVCPWAVTGEKDEVDEKGEPIYQSVNYSTLVPFLWQALQDALHRLHDLEQRVDKSN